MGQGEVDADCCSNAPTGAPSIAPSIAPTADPTEGACESQQLVVGAISQSCNDACIAVGKECTTVAITHLDTLVDTSANLGALFSTHGYTCTGYGQLSGRAAPNIVSGSGTSGQCNIHPDPSSRVYACGFQPLGSSERRLCNCCSAPSNSPSNAPSNAPTNAPTWSSCSSCEFGPLFLSASRNVIPNPNP